MKPQVEIYDTTLRDGSQGEGINFSVADKLRIAEKLDAFGVHYIEGGWPGSNPKDIEFFAQAKKSKFKNARLAAFGSTRKKATPVEQDDQVRLLIEAGTPVVTIYGKTSMLHVKEVLRCTPEENLAMIGDTVKFLKDHGKFVIYDAEHAFDGYKLDRRLRARHVAGGGKSRRGFCGVVRHERRLSAEEIAAITKIALGKLNCKVGIHTHDDIGLGVANALAALEAGAVHVQGTINGYGERTGNCNLTSVIPCVALKLKKTCVPAKSLAKLKELSAFVDEVANLRHNPRLPWVGSAAFAHKGGAHVNAVQKLASSYEHIDPDARRQRAQHSHQRPRRPQQHRHQGAGTRLQAHERHAGVEADSESRQGTGKPRLRIRGRRRFDGAAHPQGAEAIASCSSTWTRITSRCAATQRNPFARRPCKFASAKNFAQTVAEGDGPVNALDAALRSGAGEIFPAAQKA